MAKKLVLFSKDDIFATQASHAFTQENFAVLRVSSPSEGRASLEDFHPDVFVIDCGTTDDSVGIGLYMITVLKNAIDHVGAKVELVAVSILEETELASRYQKYRGGDATLPAKVLPRNVSTLTVCIADDDPGP